MSERHPLHKILVPFHRTARRPLAKIIHYFLRRMDGQDQRIKALEQEIAKMALDLTKLNAALTAVQNYVTTHQNTSAADQTAVDGVAAQIVAAVTPAVPVTPVDQSATAAS